MITLRITWKYCVAFYCIIMLYVSLHELVHHFSGYLICGDWGYKSFNYFATACEGTSKSWYATYTGPLFSFAMMYVGAHLIRKNKSSYLTHLGFAMIFAQLPLQRMISPLFRMNDEYVATVNLFGDSPWTYWSTIVVIWFVCLPPLIQAYKVIANERKWVWFLFYLALFPYVLWGPIFGTLEYLMVNKDFLAQTFIGIGLLFIINELVTVVAYFFTKRFIDPEYVHMAGEQVG